MTDRERLEPRGSRPNVLLVVADDLGFSDLGCYGGEIDTPHLDGLACHGVRMSQFYVNPRCSPSRASLLTGQYAHQVGIGVLTSDDRPFGYRGDLVADVPTLAERFGEAGYRTCLSGKWHLSTQTRIPSESWPTRRGFDDFFGILRGATSYFQPKTLTRAECDAEQEASSPTFYLTDALAAHAVSFIEDAAQDGHPFFLYFAPTAPHWPLQAPEESIAAQRGHYDHGWDVTRRKRHRRLLELGVLEASSDLSHPAAQPDDWEDPAVDREWEARRMEVYAAQVTRLDAAVGRILGALRRVGAEQNTLVVFLSDNGACDEEILTSDHIGSELKPDTCPPTTRAGMPVRVGNAPGIVPGSEDTFASYGRRWANVSNTPFRMYKRWVHEGGIAAPLIARWPQGGITSGRVEPTMGHVIDLAPTLLAAAGLEGSAGLPGIDLTTQWRDSTRSAEDTASRSVFWEHVGNAAVRRDHWKLVREADSPWELYDMSVDRSELNDLAHVHPDLVDELAHEWQQWAVRVGVIPWPEIVAAYVNNGRDASAAEG